MISRSQYENKKRALSDQLLSLRSVDSVALEKSTSNLFRHRKQQGVTRIRGEQFNDIISIDKSKALAEVEGMTSYEKLFDETLAHGLMPAVVPQLKSITIGGAVTGGGIESSSFKEGLVHETITEMEILLSDGKTVVCTKENEYRDLFLGFPNSYGTLGYALKLKVKLNPVKKYVKITHHRYDNAKDFFHTLKKHCVHRRADFIDGTLFSENEFYLTLGEFVEQAPELSDYTYMNIYYKSIRDKKIDYLTTYDYIWRWDTDWFWCSKFFFVQNPVVRFFWGKKRLRSMTYTKLMKLNHQYPIFNFLSGIFGKRESVIQDVQIPIDNCEAFTDFFQKEIGISPIWICPTHAQDRDTVFELYKMDPDKLYVNFGFWDVIKTRHEGYHNRKVEEMVKQLNGKKSLYSSSFYSEDEFWELHNKNAYNCLKSKYDPSDVFHNLYEKCVLKH